MKGKDMFNRRDLTQYFKTRRSYLRNYFYSSGVDPNSWIDYFQYLEHKLIGVLNEQIKY